MSQPRNFGFGEDETILRDSARKFLADNASVEALRRLVARDHKQAYESAVPPAPWDEALWQQMVELGWPSLAVPERAGGVGMKMVAVAALAEEAGRAALVSPLITTMLATCVLRECDTPAASAALERIVGGAPMALAMTNARGSWAVDDTDVTATPSAGGVVLSGTASFVQDARKVRAFVVAARGGGEVGLYLVDADAPGVAIHPDRVVDLTRDQARVSFADVRVPADRVVAAGTAGAEALRRAVPALLTIVAADMCGAGEWQLQTTTAYAQVRKQFDRPLGFFQAVKHPLVNMMLAIDQARSLVYNAACAIDSEPAHAERFTRMAKASAGDMAALCSGRSVQLHGGIGFTWECDVHLWFKRQQHNQLLLGDAAYQRARLAELVD
ncbi:MAG TPA: acyl-CoA dehydrogenase family protein [Candidatus Dormibacteraeota bacterium]|nr:acyl-CoA dehydrogenase family protein [Candidatus Dormibacteraeota bacterium]